MDLSSLTQQQIAQLPPSQCQVIHETMVSSKFTPTTVKTLADLEKFMDQEVQVTFFGLPQTLPLKRAYNLLRLTYPADATPSVPQQKTKTQASAKPASVAVSLGSDNRGTKRPPPTQTGSSDTPTPAAKKQRVDPPKTSRTSANPKPTNVNKTSSTVVAPAGSPTKQDTKVVSVEVGRRMFNSTPPEPMKPTIDEKFYYKNYVTPGTERASYLKEFSKHGCTYMFYEKIFPANPALVHFSKDCKLSVRPRALRGNPNLKSELLGRVENNTYTLQPVHMTKELTNLSSIWCTEMVNALGSYTTMQPNPSKNGWDMTIYYPEAFLAEVTPDVAQLLRSIGVVPNKYFRIPAGFPFAAGRELLIHLHKKNADVFRKLNDEYGTNEGLPSRSSQVQVSQSRSYASSSSSNCSSSNEEDDVVEIKKPSDYKNVPAAQRDRFVTSQNRPKSITLPNSDKTRVNQTNNNTNTNVPSLNRSNSMGQGTSGATGFRRMKGDDDLAPVPDMSQLEAATSVLDQQMEEARQREEEEARENGRAYHFSANGNEIEAM